MRPTTTNKTELLFVLLVWIFGFGSGAKANSNDVPRDHFTRQVAPLLRERCFRCHEGRDAKAGTRLDLRDELLGKTGQSPLVVVGNSAASRLIQVVSGSDAKLKMPPEGAALSREEIGVLKKWIDEGFAWDGTVLPENESARDHWAFQPVRRADVPPIQNDEWSRSPVDRFVVAEWRSRQLSPTNETSRRNLIRRMSLDLLGLLPSWDETETFVEDQRPDAVERLFDRLLANPRYGERWGRHWLDVARWAESEGFESNHPRAFAWRYRDYVVRSLNHDQPFDQFITQQIAGDELPEYSDENLIATGYLAAARISSNEEDKWLQRNDVIVDVVNAVGSGLLGLTLHCAQCHDHKFDPVSARDYYSLHAFFATGMPLNAGLRDPELQRDFDQRKNPEFEAAVALQRALFEQGRRRAAEATRGKLNAVELAAYDKPANLRSRDEELLARQVSLKFQKTMGEAERNIDPADRKLYDELKKRIGEMSSRRVPPPQTFAFYSPVTSPHRVEVLPSLGFYPLPFEPVELARQRQYVMVRGDVHQIGEPVSPAFPEALRGDSATPPARTRRDLAAWLTRPDNPLVSRVWANRVWQYHFGLGLVATSDDYGFRGARPSHPQLLDWLAAELLDHQWSTKRLHRQIVTSAAYRLSAESNESVRRADPDNRWLTRWSVRRLESETIRDVWLATSGELDLAIGGASVPLEQREMARRRSLYLFQRRGQAAESQRLFDGPQECSSSVARRDVSTSPLQSLYLLNSEFSTRQAGALAKQIESSVAAFVSKSKVDSPNEVQRQSIVAAFQKILLRDPRPSELAAAETFWNRSPESDRLPRLCQSLLNLNEFLYLE